MGVKRLVKINNVSGLAANATTTIDFPIGPRYHAIWLSGTNIVGHTVGDGTVIKEVRIKVNGKTQRVANATEYNDLNKLFGSQYGIQNDNAAVNFMLPFFFAEPWRKSYAATDAMAWATGDLSSLQMEVDLGANAPSTLYAVVEVDNSIVVGQNGVVNQAPMGLISKWYKTLTPVNGTGLDLTTLPKRDFYQQISFYNSAITKVTLKVDNFVIREWLKVENDACLTSRGMTPVSSRFDLVIDYDDVPTSALPMVNNGAKVQDLFFHLDFSSSQSGNITTIYQLFGPAD
jgi:hypothetical protein